jgi:hypothetical protein
VHLPTLCWCTTDRKIVLPFGGAHAIILLLEYIINNACSDQFCLAFSTVKIQSFVLNGALSLHSMSCDTLIRNAKNSVVRATLLLFIMRLEAAAGIDLKFVMPVRIMTSAGFCSLAFKKLDQAIIKSKFLTSTLPSSRNRYTSIRCNPEPLFGILADIPSAPYIQLGKAKTKHPHDATGVNNLNKLLEQINQAQLGTGQIHTTLQTLHAFQDHKNRCI